MLVPGWVFNRPQEIAEVSESEYATLSYRILGDKNQKLPFLVTAEEHRKNLKQYFDHVARLAPKLP